MRTARHGSGALWTFLPLAFATLITSLDLTVANLLLPTLVNQFGADSTSTSMVILSYVLAITAFLPILGKLGDRVGHERIFMLGFVVFTLSSACCAFAWNLPSLYVFRFFQGVGGAMLTAVNTALLVRRIDPGIHGRAFGFLSLAGGIGVTLGPPVGGFLIAAWGWRWVFLINLPLGVAALVLCRKAFGPIRFSHPPVNEEFDGAGAALLIPGLFGAILTLHLLSDRILPVAPALVIVAVSTVLLALFIQHEKRIATPLIDTGLFTRPGLSGALLVSFLVVAVYDGLYFLFPFFFQLEMACSARQTGLYLALLAVVSFVCSPAAGWLTDRAGALGVCRLSVGLFAVSCGSLISLSPQTPIAMVLLPLLLFGIALSLFFPSVNLLIMSHAEAGKEGSMSSISALCGYCSTFFGILIFNYVFAQTHGLPALHAGISAFALSRIAQAFRVAAACGAVLAVVALAASLKARSGKPESIYQEIVE